LFVISSAGHALVMILTLVFVRTAPETATVSLAAGSLRRTTLALTGKLFSRCRVQDDFFENCSFRDSEGLRIAAEIRSDRVVES
jgi:hypothetical protein